MAATEEVGKDVDGHTWCTRSSHPTSAGIVRYQRCHCGVWRVLLGPGRVLAGRVGAGVAATSRSGERDTS